MLLLLLLIIILFCFLASSFVGHLPLIVGEITYILILTIILSTLVFSIMKLIINRKQKNNWKRLIVIIISMLLLIFCISKFDQVFTSLDNSNYLFSWNYHKVKEETQKQFKNNYTIQGLYKKNVEMYNDVTCKYVYNINLEDNTNITFQAYYCDFGLMWPSYSYNHNYIHYYLPYYYNLYKNNHQVTFKIDMGENIYSIPTIIYNYSNESETENFINYLFNNTGDIKYKIQTKNENSNRENTIGSWNKDIHIH